jgi:hypothetical protein
MLDQLSDIVLDPAWARQRRIDTGDPLAALHDAETASALFAQAGRLRDLAPLCHQYSRAMVQAPPAVIEVLALSGQHRRAEALAANLTDVADRMFAYRTLAIVNGSGNLDAACRCADEVERSLPSMHVDHRPMAWCWAAQAAVAAGLTDRARHCAGQAFDAVAASDEWDRANGLFWAALASRTADFEDGRARVRAALEDVFARMGSSRNQVLQAAAVSGRNDFLADKVAEMVARAKAEHSPVRIGNLALAVADARLGNEMAQLVAYVAPGAPQGEPDSIKRWAWALALSDRHGEAVDAIDHINESIERSKAIVRIASIIGESGDAAVRDRLLGKLEPLLPNLESRPRARLVQAMWTLGRREQALAEAERAITESGRIGQMFDPRTDARNEPTGMRDQAGRKTGRRAMVTSRGAVADESRCYDAERAAKGGDIARASELAGKIDIPVFKARALGAIAQCDPDNAAALRSWMQAMFFACRAGRGEVESLLPVGFRILQEVGRGVEAAALEKRIQDVDAAWQLELFVDEYASLRRSMAPGDERTRIFNTLMLAPIQLAKARPWTQAEVRSAWERGEDGSRLFAVGLMAGNRDLVIVDILAEVIRTSRSAFEQFWALRAALASGLQGKPAVAVARAIMDELDGVPRGDGSPARIGEEAHRLDLARHVLKKLQTGVANRRKTRKH